MSDFQSDVLDVESRVVATEVVDSAAAATEATPAQPVSLEQSLVPAFDATRQIALANPALVQLNALKADIAAAKVDEIDVSTKEGEERIRALLKRCVKLRTGTEKAYEAWNRPLLDAQKGVRKIVKQVEDGICPEETKLGGIVEAIETKRRLEEERKIREEQERIDALRLKVDGIEQRLVAAVTQSSAEIDSVIRELQELVITDDATSFGEFSDEATFKRGSTVSKLLEMFNAKRAHEVEQAELSRQRAEQLERDRRAEVERGLRARIAGLQTLAFSAMGKSAKDIEAILGELTAKEPLAIEFGELAAEATQVFTMAKSTLSNLLTTQRGLEKQQADQARVEREQAAERLRLVQAAAPVPAPTPAPIAAPERVLVVGGGAVIGAAIAASLAGVESAAVVLDDEHRLTEDDAPFQVPAHQEDEDQLAMSMFATKADYFEAKAFIEVKKTWDREDASGVVIDLLETLAMGDFPDPICGDLQVVSLLLNPEIQACLRARQTALIEACEVPA